MSDQYLEYTPHQYNLKICPGCLKNTERDIFQLPKGEKHNGGRLIEAITCHKCKIIYEVFS